MCKYLTCWGAESCWTVPGTESLLLTLCAVWSVPRLSTTFTVSVKGHALLLLHRLAAPSSCHQSLSWLWINTSAHCCIVQTLTNCRWMPVYRGISLPVWIARVPKVTDYCSSLKISPAVPCPARGGTSVLLTAVLYRIADPLPALSLGSAWPWLTSLFLSCRGTFSTGDNA